MAISYASPINKQAQEDENTILSIQSFQDDENPPALDCGRNQKYITTLRSMYTQVPEKGRALALQTEIRNMLDADIRLAELLRDKIAYKQYFHPKAPESMYQKPKETTFLALPDEAKLNPRLAANASPELEWFIEHAERVAYRSYRGFLPFAGLHLFSITTAGRPVLSIRGKIFHTNIYLGFCANSSMDAKSFIEEYVVKPCLEQAGLLHLFGGGGHNTSPEKFLSNLAGKHVPDGWENFSKEEQVWKESVLAFCAQRGLYFDEFGEFIEAIFRANSTLAKYASILLQLYDCPKVFDGSDTIGRGLELVYNACITILASMTMPDIAKYAYPGSKLWAKGFWARFVFVVADKITEEVIHERFERGRNSGGDFSPPERLIVALQACNKRLGIPFCEVVQDEEEKGGGKDKDKANKIKHHIDREPFPQIFYEIASEAVDAWDRYSETLQVLSLKLPEDLRGSYTRLPETAMRIALILASVSNHDSNRVELKHWAKAQEFAEILRENLHKLYDQVGTPPESVTKKLENKVLASLREKPQEWFTSREIQRKCHATAREVKPLLSDLVNDLEIDFDLDGKLSGKLKSYRIAGGVA